MPFKAELGIGQRNYVVVGNAGVGLSKLAAIEDQPSPRSRPRGT